MKCIKCGYESQVQFYQCPMCGTVQNVSPNVSNKRSAGETAAIITSIVVSGLSLVAAFIIFFAFMSYMAAKSIEKYRIDSFDDFDSNEYDDDLDDFFRDYYNSDSDSDNKYNSDSPAGRNTPISFKTELYSFSEGDIQTEYEVSMVETYRGDAALKLLEGAALPEYDKDRYDVYLVKFSLTITKQDKDAIVILPMSYPAAYPSNTISIFSDGYDDLSSLDYLNKYKLIRKGEKVETYLAFIVSKTDDSPCIRWDMTEDKVFRDDGKAISDASLVEAGAAMEKEEAASSELPEDEASSEESSSDDLSSN